MNQPETSEANSTQNLGCKNCARLVRPTEKGGMCVIDRQSPSFIGFLSEPRLDLPLCEDWKAKAP